ncbi:vacuolar protein sorting-associated protein 45 [Tilletia horrida]|uniref:Vacuolar protein sorting-associated protein 45 n=1 Tax=Tilletia horrida TaxID=155126 RepID=A0AAN6GPA2_9BASI|nr:vacuolar protein sorting-associated protein 45 [Tilletia horrida]KAK0563259.1 vacuolar protein sorting-associated protein 45 [Tilletia horrida]
MSISVVKAVGGYIERMVSEVPGIKVLILDADTTPIISTAFTQSALLAHEVYLTDRIDNTSRDRMRHLKCCAFLRPSPQSLAALVEELKMPKYSAYYLYFTNILRKSDIERLAEADEHEVVKEVQEFFADYVPVNPSLFSLNLQPPPHRIWASKPSEWDPDSLERHTSGLCALLLSLKKKPLIRYERMSSLAKKLGEEISYQMHTAQPNLFEFRRTDVPPLLLILDRRNDPVTPLLSQWTYQAMVHELIGITNGRVSLADAEKVRAEHKEIVLSADQDPFFSSNLYDNYGDLGASIKRYVIEYQSKTASTSQIETIQDMKRFVEAYPEFKKLSGNVSKHVALLGELSKRVEKEGLFEISELEQSLASNESHTQDLKAVQNMLASDKVLPEAKLRLAILYALRYQKNPQNQIANIVKMLLDSGMEESRAALVFVFLNLAGAEQRQDDLFGQDNFFSRGKSALKGLKGVENVYTQHDPHLTQTVEALMKGRLKETSYPWIGHPGGGFGGAAPGMGGGPQGLYRPQDVIIFIIGGATYEEARAVARMNGSMTAVPSAGQHQSPSTPTTASNASSIPSGGAGPGGGGTRYILGGTCIHNSASFLDMVQDAAARFPPTIVKPPPLPSATSSSGPALQLSIGPVQLAVGGGGGNQHANGGGGPASSLLDPERLGEAADGARDLARGLFERVQRGVAGISLT